MWNFMNTTLVGLSGIGLLTDLKTAEKRDRTGEGPKISRLAGQQSTSLNVIDGVLITWSIWEILCEQRSSSTSYQCYRYLSNKISQICSPWVLKLGFPNHQRVFQNKSTNKRKNTLWHMKSSLNILQSVHINNDWLGFPSWFSKINPQTKHRATCEMQLKTFTVYAFL